MPRLANHNAGWSKREEASLLRAAKNGMSVGQIAEQLGRTEPACQQKAMRLAISFRLGGLVPKRRKKRGLA